MLLIQGGWISSESIAKGAENFGGIGAGCMCSSADSNNISTPTYQFLSQKS